jgi:hypothetical protein
MNIDLGSPILDIAIGLSFVFFLLAVIASAIGEGIASVLNWRGKTLESGLEEMFGDAIAAKRLLNHKLVRTELNKTSRLNETATPEALKKDERKPKSKRKYERLSSYISPEVFAAAFKDLHAELTEVPAILQQLEALGVTGAWTGPQGDLKKVERWFDGTMDRVSGWYRRKSQIATVVIAVFVAIGLNVSAVRIVERLEKEPTVRTALVAQAEAAKEESTTEANLKEAGKAASGAYDKLEAMKVPLLWGGENVPSGVSGWVTNVLGWLLTIIAISLGAPFWFDALGKLANLRTAGKRPEDSATPKT